MVYAQKQTDLKKVTTREGFVKNNEARTPLLQPTPSDHSRIVWSRQGSLHAITPATIMHPARPVASAALHYTTTTCHRRIDLYCRALDYIAGSEIEDKIRLGQRLIVLYNSRTRSGSQRWIFACRNRRRSGSVRCGSRRRSRPPC